MKIATLGHDDQIAELLVWIRESPVHRLVAQYDDGTAGQAGGNDRESWEVLLSNSDADVVLVSARSGDSERRDDQLRKLVQAAVPLVLVHPSCEMIVGYELEMIRHDSNCIMVPYHPGIYDANFIRLAAAMRDLAQRDDIEQLIWERQSAQRDRASVMAHFARDALLLRHLMTNITHVSATGAAVGESQFANLGIHLTGAGGELARWSIGPVRGSEGANLTVVASSLTAELEMPRNPPFGLTMEPHAAIASPPVAPPAQQLFSDLESLLSASPDGAESPWEASCRALELEDAVQRSCRRGRTIELYNERVTERDTFKSMMAAGGCGMLMWVFLLLMIAGIVEGLKLPIRDTGLWQLWPVVLFAPLGLFLLLQLLIGRREG